MRAPALLRLALAGTALVASAGLAAADTTPTTVEQKLFFRNTGTTCSPGNPFLAEAPGTGDINCGYIGGGLPFGEVFSQAGLSASRTFSTQVPEDADPDALPTFRLDDAKALTGTVVVQAGSQQGQALPGAGQVRVVLDVVGQTADGGSIALGSGDQSVTAVPPARTVSVPFSFDLADSVGDVDLVGITATLTTRGVHVFHGFARMNDSTLTLPVVREAATPAAQAEATEE